MYTGERILAEEPLVTLLQEKKKDLYKKLGEISVLHMHFPYPQECRD